MVSGSGVSAGVGDGVRTVQMIWIPLISLIESLENVRKERVL